MRVTSTLFVAALVRRCYGQGATAVVVRHGADEAGAIFIIVDNLGGSADLYGPAPQSAFEEARPSERLFQKIAEGDALDAITTQLERETRFDPDLWIVAIEDRDGRVFFDVG